MVIHNLSAIPREVCLEIGPDDEGCLVNLLSAENNQANAQRKHCIMLEPYGCRWFRVGGLDYILKRSSI